MEQCLSRNREKNADLRIPPSLQLELQKPDLSHSYLLLTIINVALSNQMLE